MAAQPDIGGLAIVIGEVIKAGTSEGAKKGWQRRGYGGMSAEEYSKRPLLRPMEDVNKDIKREFKGKKKKRSLGSDTYEKDPNDPSKRIHMANIGGRMRPVPMSPWSPMPKER